MADVWVGIGKSSRFDSFEAGREAASIARDQLPTDPGVSIVFGSCRFDHRELLSGIESVVGDVAMVGGTTAGEICTNGFTTHSVVIMMLASDELSFITGIGKDMSAGEHDCAVALVNHILDQSGCRNQLSLMVFPNGMGGDGVEFIQGLHSVLGSEVEIVGGFLGDDERFEYTFQYYNGKVYRDAATGLLICGSADFTTGIGVQSGFQSIGNRFYCTESEGNVVKKFDNERALDLYKEFLGEQRVPRLPGICLEYPFGLIDEKIAINGKEYIQIRCGLTVDHEEGTITLAGSIPQGSAVTLTTASRKDLIEGARVAAEQAKTCIGKARPLVVFMFSCVGRKLVLGRRTAEEVQAVKDVLGNDIPLIGFYTYGEIGPINKLMAPLKMACFHNETVVIWVLAQNQTDVNR